MMKTSRELIKENFSVADENTKIPKNQKKALELFDYWLRHLSKENDIELPEVKVAFCTLPKEERARTYYFFDEKFAIVQISKKATRDKWIERTIVHEISHVLQFSKCDKEGIELGKNKHNNMWKKIFKKSGFDTNYNFDIYS